MSIYILKYGVFCDEKYCSREIEISSKEELKDRDWISIKDKTFCPEHGIKYLKEIYNNGKI